MLPVIACPTVSNRQVVEFVLNLPYTVFFLPLVAVAGLGNLNASNAGLFFLGFVDALVTLMGLLYPVRLIYLRWLAKNHGG